MSGEPTPPKSESTDAIVTILVAEDDPHDQMLFVMAADDSHVEVELEFASDGEELLEELERRAVAGARPDLVVLDMRMPRMNGHEVLDALADRPDISPREIGVFSTSFRRQDIDRSLAKGAAWHVVKPSRYEELVAFVQDIVARCIAARSDRVPPAIRS